MRNTNRDLVYRLFDRVPGHSLAALRISWGVVMLSEAVRFMQDDFYLTQEHLVSPSFAFPYRGFEWIWRCRSLDIWKCLLWIMALSCIAFSIGLAYRLATTTFFVLFTFLFLQDSTIYLNHYYLICVLGGVFCWLPANRMWALDPQLKLARHETTVPYWSVALCRLYISIVYFYSGIAKMNEDWIRGEPLLHWVPKRCSLYPSMCWLLQHSATALGMSWCGLLFDLFCPFLFSAGGNYRKIAFAASTFFHCCNMMLFNIGVFPTVMMVISMIYCDFDWPLQVCRAFVLRCSKLRTTTTSSKNDVLFPSPPTIPRDRNKPLTSRERQTLFLLGTFTLIQVYLPIRHIFYPGNVAWNERGHLFSWRMKLRDKMGMTNFYLTPPADDNDGLLEPNNDNSKLVHVEDFLTDVQIKRMVGQPHMTFQTVDEIVRRYMTDQLHNGMTTRPPLLRPRVHVVSIASVNYRADQFLLDPRINYANVTIKDRREEYITPFVARNCNSSCPFVVEELRRGSRNAKFRPKKRLFQQYRHVGLSEAVEFYERSRNRPMPESNSSSVQEHVQSLLQRTASFAFCISNAAVVVAMGFVVIAHPYVMLHRRQEARSKETNAGTPPRQERKKHQ